MYITVYVYARLFVLKWTFGVSFSYFLVQSCMHLQANFKFILQSAPFSGLS